MQFSIYVAYEDGARELIDQFKDMQGAAARAIRLADEIGKAPIIDGHGPPATIDLYDYERLEISIRIIMGGLLPADRWQARSELIG